ncbi:MAG: tRNA (guanosine(46)-N7)-methyltransferase TrmB [Candidatus Absconditabacterales bacterium]
MPKTHRYAEFTTLPNTYTYSYKDPALDMGLDLDRPIIAELGCGSGIYTRELATIHPQYQYIGIDMKSDRLHFGAKYCAAHGITNTKRLCASVDHISSCFPEQSISEIWITFPDPRPTRDRQKLTSPKYQAIYHALMKPGGVIHLKTDDKAFWDYSMKSLVDGGWIIRMYIEDIYKQTQKKLPEELLIQTYYEAQRLTQGRKIYYLQVYKQD